ncbi:MAG: PIG-L family deacetylase [Planctomycetes bacterium]|nr:PIG-L family deacetylase [Planctomycetota bacterium]MBU4400133.1 PIG-L family deacetylase [Planctomycetota bacterium]MCG2684273.1 PIG-L family deacetylase [Planctomycetales bacterium]
MLIPCQRLLVLAPHTDDAELGCGATIARFVEEGVPVHVAAFSTAEESRPPGSDEGMLKKEFLRAMPALGVEPANLRVYDFPVRKLSYHRQEVLEELVSLRTSVNPDMVLVPSGADVHQDHQVLYKEAVRAFKQTTLWGYELPWNHITFAAQAFVIVEERHLDRKWRALGEYESQLMLNRLYFQEEFVRSLARVRGAQVGAEYAEAFEVVRTRL